MEFKLCQMCKKRPANLHVAQLSNNEYVSIDLCEECAEKKGVTASNAGNLVTQASLTELLEKLLKKELRVEKDETEPQVKCPGCERSYQDFQESGQLGCAQCYATFFLKLGSLVEKVQKSQAHRGKVPELSSASYEKQRRLLECRQKLRVAVGNEEFEEAARLRDHIRELEEQLQTN